MFTIDFMKPWLYKDIIYFNQSNLTYQKVMTKVASDKNELDIYLKEKRRFNRGCKMKYYVLNNIYFLYKMVLEK